MNDTALSAPVNNLLSRTGSAVLSGVDWLVSVIFRAAYRFYWDDCFSRAAALSYTTLFALVPITALSFSMFGVFGLSNEQLSTAMRTILEQVLPPMRNAQLQELQAQVFNHLQLFSQNVRALSTVSIAVLVFTSVALLNTIESAVNVIFRVSSTFSLSKIASFWTVVTLGPLFIALSIYWTTKVGFVEMDAEWSTLYAFAVSYVIPVAVTCLGLSLLFYKLPAARVSIRDAVVGGIVAAILFEFVKRGFAYYVGLSTTYSTIYGVLTTVPLFLFWLYVAWCVVLYGAEISYQCGSIHILSGLRRYATDLGDIGAVLGLRILYCIGKRFLAGDPPPTETDIAIETGSDPVLVRTCLNVLTEANIISIPDEKTHARGLIVAPEKVAVGQILRTFRSKEHLRMIARGKASADENPFLDVIRKASEGIRDSRPMTEWTLYEMITGEAQRNASK